jgi:hypothetical protein
VTTRRAARIALALAIAAACTRSVSGKESPMTGSSGQGSAHPAAPTLAMSASLTATKLHVVLTNHGSGELKVLSHVAAGQRIDLDWYTVTLKIGGAARELRFAGDRDHAGRVQKALAAGASIAHDIDLDWWAKQATNGGVPLPRGAGTLVAVYEVTGEPGVWNGRVESPPVAVSW